jgi:hypothetical protein
MQDETYRVIKAKAGAKGRGFLSRAGTKRLCRMPRRPSQDNPMSDGRAGPFSCFENMVGKGMISTLSRLRQLLLNLLSNAIRFTPGGIHPFRRGLISIADTGQGIRVDFKSHLFDHAGTSRRGPRACNRQRNRETARRHSMGRESWRRTGCDLQTHLAAQRGESRVRDVAACSEAWCTAARGFFLQG